MQTLRDVPVGTTATVRKLHGEGPLKRRVMDMGITKGVEIYVRKVAPLGDPLEISVRGYELSLRRADADIIEIEGCHAGAPAPKPSPPPRPKAVRPARETEVKIALAGNPNCGKTTLFNALTGGNQYVGNWPGVTVEKKDGRLKGHKDVVIQDLPGIYSLSPYSLEEVVARSYLVEERPDAILNIVDGTNIERNLYLTTQLLELGIPTVVAVNMMDVVRKNGDEIDLERLSRELRCPVVPISALTGEGAPEAASLAVGQARSGQAAERPHVFSGTVEHAIAHIEESIQDKAPAAGIRWYAIKIFERDAKAYAGLGLDKDLVAHLDEHIVECEKEMDDDCESIITDQRYRRVQELASLCVRRRRGRGGLSLSDKIDRVVTNRVLALPIFAAVIWLMYYVSVTTVGSWMTDWANDGVFGAAGWHLAWPTGAKAAAWKADSDAYAAAQARIRAYEAAGGGDAARLFRVEDGESGEVGNYPVALDEYLASSVADEEAFARIGREDILALFDGDGAPKDPALVGLSLVGEDGAMAIRAAGAGADGGDALYPLSAFIADGESAAAARAIAEPNPRDSAKYGPWVPSLPALADRAFRRIGVPEDSGVHRIVFDVIFHGVGTVLGFVPQIMVIFLFLSFLEDVGYMARIAFIMDRIFNKFGLSGKSFIPILIGMGCGVPAVMAARTIEAQRDRRMTIMLGTYIPCSAKAAIIAMFVPAFFSKSAWVASAMYFAGIAVIVLGGLVLKKFRAFAGDPAPFVMELPAYHLPTLRNIAIHTWDRTRAYMVKAGTIIFAACTALWLLMNFDWSFHYLGEEGLSESMLADIRRDREGAGHGDAFDGFRLRGGGGRDAPAPARPLRAAQRRGAGDARGAVVHGLQPLQPALHGGGRHLLPRDRRGPVGVDLRGLPVPSRLLPRPLHLPARGALRLRPVRRLDRGRDLPPAAGAVARLPPRARRRRKPRRGRAMTAGEAAVALLFAALLFLAVRHVVRRGPCEGCHREGCRSGSNEGCHCEDCHRGSNEGCRLGPSCPRCRKR